jgi:hypothetical protein
VCANGIDERGFALAARTPPAQPTRRSALQSVDLAVRNAGYSIFDSALYGKHTVEWLFPQEKATFDAVPMSTSESKMP